MRVIFCFGEIVANDYAEGLFYVDDSTAFDLFAPECQWFFISRSKSNFITELMCL